MLVDAVLMAKFINHPAITDKIRRVCNIEHGVEGLLRCDMPSTSNATPDFAVLAIWCSPSRDLHSHRHVSLENLADQ